MNEILRQSPVADNLDPFGLPINPADLMPTDEQLAEVNTDPEIVAACQQLESACRE